MDDRDVVAWSSERNASSSDGLGTFVALAWGTTWLLALPLAASWWRGLSASGYMFALAGLSAFGPTFSAFVVARRQGRLREVFGRFRTNPFWVFLALATPLLLHLAARLLEVALGGRVAQWVWLPQTPAQVAAVVLFSLGEEFGWRGFAHPRLTHRYGPALGPLVTGAIWGFWHLAYVVTPQGTLSPLAFALMLLEISLWALVVAWLYERSNRSMSVALAVHAGAHLDNSARIPTEDWRLKLLTILVIGIAAAFAARSLAMEHRARLRATALAP